MKLHKCKTCGYWNEKKWCCTNEHFAYIHDLLGMGIEDIHKIPPDYLAYWDSEGWSAGVNMGPEFGCVHHSEYEQE